MLYFDRFVFQQMSVAFFVGWILFIIFFMAWGYYPRQREEKAREEKPEPRGYELASGHQVARNPIAPFLVVFYIGNLLWMLGYVVIIGFFGGPIGG